MYSEIRYTQQARRQPFFATDPLTRFVRECEANIELLFPLEAEVIESGTEEGDEKSNAEALPANEDKNDVYRSIIAAMRAIQGLRKASSTYNPLSLARFFRDQDDEEDATGAVTAENSDSD